MTRENPEVPAFFRLDVEVGNLDEAESFYETLLQTRGQRHAGARIYFKAGPVTLQVCDVSGWKDLHPAAKALYFSSSELDAVHARADQLGCLSKELVHGQVGGELSVRPWGERSFYCEDPWGNPLCFVERGTEYL